jgi:predicted HTH transcriptional regulator
MMNNEELENLVQKGENERIEFKSIAALKDKEEIARQIVAFANRYGGKILFGITDDGKIEKPHSISIGKV